MTPNIMGDHLLTEFSSQRNKYRLSHVYYRSNNIRHNY